MTATLNSQATPSHGDIQLSFLGVLPRIRKHSQYALRHIACRDAREELIAETMGALAWRHFVSLTRRGKRPEDFIATLALRCTQAVRAGRRLAGCERSQDVLSPIAKARHGVSVVHLEDRVPVPGPDPTRPGVEIVAEAFTVDPKARVPEQAALRIDFREWRGRFAARGGRSSTRAGSRGPAG